MDSAAMQVVIKYHGVLLVYNHRRNLVCDDGDLSPPLLKVVVTVTTTFSKWNLYFGQEKSYFSCYQKCSVT